MSGEPLTAAELAAMKLLNSNHRLMVTIVPEGASDELCARVSTFTNFILDTRLLPPVILPATVEGDGLHCPYCGTGLRRSRWTEDIERHSERCSWRKAIRRWSLSNARIDREFDGPTTPPQEKP